MPCAPFPVGTKWSTAIVAASIPQTPLRSMSATRKWVPSGARRTSCGIEEAPGCSHPAWPPMAPGMDMESAGLVAPGVLMWFRSMTERMAVTSASRTSSCPVNSQLIRMLVRSALKSAWLMPRHGTGTERLSAMVVGSRTSMRLSRSAMTSASEPSGGEVQVVRVVGGHGAPDLSGRRVDGRQGVAGVTVDPQRGQVVAGHDVFRGPGYRVGRDDRGCARVADLDG